MISNIRHHWTQDVPESEIAFCVQLYNSGEQLRWFAPLLREHYPNARVSAVCDGDGCNYADVAEQYDFALIHGEHLMELSTCHLYVVRMLQALICGPETYLFKIDPDVRIWRRFRSLPAFTSMFGTLEYVSEAQCCEIRPPPNVQGGMIGMTNDAARCLVDSGIISHTNCTVRFSETWARCSDMIETALGGSFCDDFVLSWAASELSIPIINAPEIRSHWRKTPPDCDLRFAATHPHKLT